MSATLEDSNIGISGGERLDRIERLLEKVLDKLDGKAEAAALVALEGRVRDIELHGSATAIAAIADTKALDDVVGKLSGRIAWGTGALAAIVFFVNIGLYLAQHGIH